METATPGFREMEEKDLEAVGILLRKYLAKFDIIQTFDTEEDLRHWFIGGRGIGEYNPGNGKGREGQAVWAYVVEVSLISVWLKPILNDYG